MHSEEVLVLGDFAENYQFLIQDKIQCYHWSKEYCTLHPVVVYFKDDTASLWHISICFVSNDNSHNTCFLYEVQKTMINYLHELLPQVKKLFYFSDGCGGHYKNYKNFMNLCLHKQDFGLDAELIFFANSHDNSWDWWLSKTPSCKKKFAKTNEQSDSRLSGYA